MKLLYLGVGAALLSLSQVMGEDTVDINTPFKVASGSQKGSCDDKKDILNHMLQQTTDMATSAGDAIGEIIQRTATDQSSSRMMFMLFQINGLLGWIRDGIKLPKATRTYLGKTIGRECPKKAKGVLKSTNLLVNSYSIL